MRAKPFLVGLTAVVCALLVSCDKGQKSGAGAGAGDLAGTYRLLSVDGKNVPAVITHENAKVEIRSGSLTINNDGTCVSKMTFVPPSGKEGSQEVSAIYSRNGDKLDMEWKEMGKTTGTLQGSTFTMNNEGMVLVYQK